MYVFMYVFIHCETLTLRSANAAISTYVRTDGSQLQMLAKYQ